MLNYPTMLRRLCTRSRCRVFIVPLCAFVFVLALQTRLPFKPQKVSIKAFADDYDRLKAKATRIRSVAARVSLRSATQFISSFLFSPRPHLQFHAADAVADIPVPPVCFVGLGRSIRPPPPSQ
jgi:hypothetical protein